MPLTALTSRVKLFFIQSSKLKAIKTAETIALAAGGVLLYSLWRKQQGIGTLNFFPDKVRDFHFSGLTPVFTLGLGVQNTSNQSFTVNSIAGNAYSNGYYVGNLSNFSPQIIIKNTQGILLLDVRLALIGIVNDLINAFQSENFQQSLELKATANVDNLQIPLNIKYKIG